MMQMQISQFVRQHPQQVQQIQQVIMQAMQTGELTPQELNMMIQLATAAAQSPEIYPNIRRFAIQQGIATEQDLPPQYDPGLVAVLLIAAQAVQQGQGVGSQPMQPPAAPGAAPAAPAAPMGIPAMKDGGAVPSKGKSGGGVLIQAHEGEYVIPAHVVKMKGKEFFDSMLEKYAGNK
jgi:hypothetical protein